MDVLELDAQQQAEGAEGGAAVAAAAAAAAEGSADYSTDNVLGELAGFTLPLLVVWLSSPIVSLVDTAVVGMGSSAQLAALGPSTSLFDSVAYTCIFLASVTTNIVASANAIGDEVAATRATNTGLVIGLATGVICTALFLYFGRPIMSLFLGAGSPLLDFTMQYLNIRALGYIGVTVGMVLQGVCMANKNVRTPLVSCAVGSVVNLVFDLILVCWLGMGIAGAAVATTVSQYLAAYVLWIEVMSAPKVAEGEGGGAAALAPKRGIGLPTWGEAKEYMGLGLPTAAGLTAQISTASMLTVAASACSTAALAGHQVVYSIFLLFCPVGEAISQTVQAFLPALMFNKTRSRQPGRKRAAVKRAMGRKKAVKERPSVLEDTLTLTKAGVGMVKTVLGLGAIFGVADMILSAAIPCGLPMLFTPDRAVWTHIRGGSLWMGAGMLVHALTMTFQGILMAAREVGTMSAIYMLTSAMFCTKFGLMRAGGITSLSLLWKTFFWYQVTRCALFGVAVMTRNRDAFKEHWGGRKGKRAEKKRQEALLRQGVVAAAPTMPELLSGDVSLQSGSDDQQHQHPPTSAQ